MHIPAAAHEGRAASDYPLGSLSPRSPVRSRLPSWAVLNRWLVGGSLLVLVLLAALVLNVVNTRQQQHIARLVSHTNDLLDAIADTRAQLLLLASTDQTFLLSGAADDLRRIVPITKQAVQSGQRIEETGRDDPREQARLMQVLVQLQVVSDYYTSALEGATADDSRFARDRLLSGYGPRLVVDLNERLTDMEDIARGQLADRAAASERAYRTALATGVVTGISSIALLVCFVVLLRRHLVHSQRDAAALRALSEELRMADRRKDQFLATLAHELRNPLAPIRTAASSLASSQLDPAKLAWFRDVISRQVTHMSVLLDDLLDISRITRGKLTLRPAPVSLATVVDTALEAARPLIERKQHEIRVHLPHPMPIVDVDQVRMSQSLTNLLTNAAKYTDPGGQIELSGTRAGGDLVLSVTDNGIGVAPHLLQQIFGMFAQVDSEHRRSEGGLGIGLALTRGLVELQGGTISARSEGSGCGTTFTITLPAVVVGEVEARPEVAMPDVGDAGPGRQGQGILIVDRNRDAADALGILLEMAGHPVSVAVTVQEALETIARESPRIAFLDVGMPLSEQLASDVRASGEHGHIVLVAVSERGDQEAEARAAEAAFDHHLTKPVELEDVEALLARPRREPSADSLATAAGAEGAA